MLAKPGGGVRSNSRVGTILLLEKGTEKSHIPQKGVFKKEKDVDKFSSIYRGVKGGAVL